MRKYTVIPRELTYQTFTNGLSAGQLQTVTLSKYGINAAEFLIDRVTIRDLDDQGTFVYDIHAVDGEPFGSWTKFFESLVRKESGLVIDPDEKLIVLKTSYETDSWSEIHSYTIFACPIVADTLYPSDTLYPC